VVGQVFVTIIWTAAAMVAGSTRRAAPTRVFVRLEPDHPQGFRVTFHQRPRGDHLADVEASTMLSA